MRCRLSEKTVRKYAKKAGLNPEDFVTGLTRGNTHHRIDLFHKDQQTIYCFYLRDPTDVFTEPRFHPVQ